MKKILMTLLLMSTGIIAAVAKPQFKSIDNYGRLTTIVLVDNDINESATIGTPIFYNNGEQLQAKSVKVQEKDGQTFITLKFKRCTRFDRAFVSININGKSYKVTMNLGGVIL